MTLPPVLSKKIQLEAEQLMWAPTPLEINEDLHVTLIHFTLQSWLTE